MKDDTGKSERKAPFVLMKEGMDAENAKRANEITSLQAESEMRRFHQLLTPTPEGTPNYNGIPMDQLYITLGQIDSKAFSAWGMTNEAYTRSVIPHYEAIASLVDDASVAVHIQRRILMLRTNLETMAEFEQRIQATRKRQISSKK